MRPMVSHRNNPKRGRNEYVTLENDDLDTAEELPINAFLS